MNYKNLNPDKALIWRITHRRNMPWILANGLHAVNSQARSLLQQRNFKRDPNDPEKVERYQAEALIYRQAPLQALLGVVCNTSQVKSELEEQVARSGVQLGVYCRPQWYF